MARQRNTQNIKTEKKGIQILKALHPTFHVLTKDERKILYEKLKIDYGKYNRSIDGIILNVNSVNEIKSIKDCELVEIKTTAAIKVKELPYDVFFGITKNEEDLFNEYENYRLCIVHTELNNYYLMRYKEYRSLTKNKRTQYQVNFKSKNG